MVYSEMKPQIQTGNMKRTRPWAAAAGITLFALLVLASWMVVELPVEVPDTASPPEGNDAGTIIDVWSVRQSFVVERDDLSRVSLIVAVERPATQGEIVLHLRESADGEPIRTVKRSLSELRAGDPMRMTPGLRTEHWEEFPFEPIPDSAGRKYYMSIEGRGFPVENSVKVLSYFHSKYPQGEAYYNNDLVNANLVFRASSQGNALDLLSILAGNLTHNRPGVFSSGVLYVGLVAVYLVLTLILLGVARRAARPSG